MRRIGLRAARCMRTYVADTVLLPQGWASDVLIEVEPSGNIAGVRYRCQVG